MAQSDVNPMYPEKYISTVTNRAYQDWGESAAQQQWAKEQFAKNAALTDKVTGGALDASSMFGDWARKDRGVYEGTYMPLMQQQAAFARDYASPERMMSNRAAAMAGVNQAFDRQAQEAERRLQGFDIDPSAGRYRGLDAAVETAKAAALAGAGTKSDRDTEALGQEYLDRAIGRGGALPSQVLNTAGTGLAFGNQAVNAALAQTQSGASTMGTGLQWGAKGDENIRQWLAGHAQGTAAGLEGQRVDLDRQKFQSTQSSGVGAAIGTGLGIAGAIAGGMYGGPMGAAAGAQAGQAIGSGFTAARGGMIRRYAEGGEVEDELADDEMVDGGDEYVGEALNGEIMPPTSGVSDNVVPPEASPSGGEDVDDVHAMVSEGEFIIPKDVTSWLGEKFLQKLIEKARMEIAGPKEAEPEMTSDMPDTPPTFQSEGAMQTAWGGGPVMQGAGPDRWKRNRTGGDEGMIYEPLRPGDEAYDPNNPELGMLRRMQPMPQREQMRQQRAPAFQDGGEVRRPPFEGLGRVIKDWANAREERRNPPPPPSLFPLAEHERWQTTDKINRAAGQPPHVPFYPPAEYVR